MDTIRKRFANGVQAGETSRMVIWAGSGVGFMKNIVPAQVRPHYSLHAAYISSIMQEIVDQLHNECLLCIRQAQSLIQYD